MKLNLSVENRTHLLVSRQTSDSNNNIIRRKDYMAIYETQYLRLYSLNSSREILLTASILREFALLQYVVSGDK